MTFNSVKVLSLGLYLLIALFSLSCKMDKKKVPINENELREQLMDANKNILRSEFHLIDSFILKHNYHLKETGSGLRYEIVKKTEGRKAEPGDEVMIRYKAYFLNGEPCQQSSSGQPEKVKLGEAKLIRGLEEVLLLMREGEVARLVVPSHLAFGIRGHGESVPPAAILYYEINLMAIKK